MIVEWMNADHFSKVNVCYELETAGDTKMNETQSLPSINLPAGKISSLLFSIYKNYKNYVKIEDCISTLNRLTTW